MKPIKFIETNVVFAKDQPQYLPLPAHKDDFGRVTTCWKLSFKQRVKLLFTGKIWIQVLTFNHSLQPQLPSIEKPNLKEYHG